VIGFEGTLICETSLLKSIDREDVDILNHLPREPDSYTTLRRHTRTQGHLALAQPRS
jgi:hypothetical protein